MGSSGSSDFEEPPRGPNPPSNMIIPQGGSAPLKTKYIKLHRDTNTPSTGLTPDMLQAIMATQNPPQQNMAPPGAAAAAPVAAGPVSPQRDQLAMALMRRGSEGGASHTGAGSGGNRGGWGGH
jgi:hypothetical protein